MAAVYHAVYVPRGHGNAGSEHCGQTKHMKREEEAASEESLPIEAVAPSHSPRAEGATGVGSVQPSQRVSRI